ncbi:MAG TPA: arsenate reductase ArsC [Deltaproteobacteria bacterium]|nr:arsenate reductase ArsC [Deltaproteobacteria bacterium]
MEKIRVLFLCTGNSARSQIAEAFLRAYGSDRFDAFSAGLEPKRVHPLTIKVMDEIGIDMSGHTSKHLDRYLGTMHFSYVVTVCSHADVNCPAIFPGGAKRLHWDFEDPAAFKGTQPDRLAKFRQVRDQIGHRVRQWIEEQTH